MRNILEISPYGTVIESRLSDTPLLQTEATSSAKTTTKRMKITPAVMN